ncbi:MAG TPA: hypothetical protein DCE11_03820 [Ruminiclostridium sp.]|nr:hypothetical protein [Ruminiclostridium sp.]
MKKISPIVFLILLMNLLSGCGLLSYSDNEEVLGEEEGRNTEVQLTQDPDNQTLPGPGETTSDGTESESAPEDTYKTDTGFFQGQIDNNFIEIAISGVPEEKAIRVFILSDDIREEFGGMELSIGDAVKFQYYSNESEQNVIVKIEKLN